MDYLAEGGTAVGNSRYRHEYEWLEAIRRRGPSLLTTLDKTGQRTYKKLTTVRA
jgi:hypothetical protein